MKYGNKLKKIISSNEDNFTVCLRFTNGKEGLVDLSYLFSKPKGLASEILIGRLFNQCFIESGALAWPNGLELCPDSLFMKITSVAPK